MYFMFKKMMLGHTSPPPLFTTLALSHIDVKDLGNPDILMYQKYVQLIQSISVLNCNKCICVGQDESLK